MAPHPGSKRPALMKEKEELARRLLTRGLTVSQISAQLGCSQSFVRRIAREQRSQSVPETETE